MDALDDFVGIGQDDDIVSEESDGVDLQVVSLNKTDPFGEIVHRRQFRNR